MMVQIIKDYKISISKVDTIIEDVEVNEVHTEVISTEVTREEYYTFFSKLMGCIATTYHVPEEVEVTMLELVDEDDEEGERHISFRGIITVKDTDKQEIILEAILSGVKTICHSIKGGN